MNSIALRETLKIITGDKIPHYVVAADSAIKEIDVRKTPFLAIQNCSKEDSPGSHWICWYALTSSTVEYLDSYGKPVSKYPDVEFPIENIVRESCLQLQDDQSNLCGLYCLAFAHYRLLGFSYDYFLSLFGEETLQNDLIICRWAQKYLPTFHVNKINNTKIQNSVKKCHVIC